MCWIRYEKYCLVVNFSIESDKYNLIFPFWNPLTSNVKSWEDFWDEFVRLLCVQKKRNKNENFLILYSCCCCCCSSLLNEGRQTKHATSLTVEIEWNLFSCCWWVDCEEFYANEWVIEGIKERTFPLSLLHHQHTIIVDVVKLLFLFFLPCLTSCWSDLISRGLLFNYAWVKRKLWYLSLIVFDRQILITLTFRHDIVS